MANVENKGEEKVDMCKALDDLYKMGEEKGYERGKQETEQNMCKALDDLYKMGEENKHVDQIRKKIAKGKDIATIADEIEETEDVVNQLIEKHNL